MALQKHTHTDTKREGTRTHKKSKMFSPTYLHNFPAAPARNKLFYLQPHQVGFIFVVYVVNTLFNME